MGISVEMREKLKENTKSLFNILEKNLKNKRDMSEVNEALNEELRTVGNFLGTTIEATEFDKKYEPMDDRSLCEVAFEKSLFLYSLWNVEKYTEIVKNEEKQLEIMYEIPFLKFLIDYKFEKYGFEIFKDMGLEIKGFTSDKKISVIEREDMSEEQRLKWEKQKEKMEKEGNLETRDIFLENNDKEIENEIQA